MERAAAEDEIADKIAAAEDEIANKNAAPIAGAPTTHKKQKTSASTDRASSAAAVVGASDDMVGTILARLPARTAIACTALSKHHRSLVRSPEFRSLHCHLSAPLPSPHVAYLAAAPIHRRPEKEHLASQCYGFHLASAGAGLTGNGVSPVCSLVGWRYIGMDYVNTCNGVLLISSKGFSDPCRCTLWNPAIADVAREATVPIPRPSSEKETSGPIIVLPDEKGRSSVQTEVWHSRTQFMALGLGHAQRSKTYKLLIACRKEISKCYSYIHGGACSQLTHHYEYSLLVHSLGVADTADKETVLPLRTVLDPMETTVRSLMRGELDKEIIPQRSLYMDSKIYLLYLHKSVILAFDVDDETVHSIALPGDCPEVNIFGEQEANARRWARAKVELIEMSGPRPCLVINENETIALWLLKPDYQLEPIHVISYNESDIYSWCPPILGVWDCSGVLVLWLDCYPTDKFVLYDVAAKKIYRADVPGDMKVEMSDYMLCWGYKPTLVSPGSIVGELDDQGMERRRGRSARITEVINPLILRDRRKGQKAAMNTVCLMEILIRIMQKLPDDMQDVLEMPLMDSEEPDLLFQSVV